MKRGRDNMYYMRKNEKDAEAVELYEETDTSLGKITRFMAIIFIDSLPDEIIDAVKEDTVKVKITLEED
jgi:hypothetical protein